MKNIIMKINFEKILFLVIICLTSALWSQKRTEPFTISLPTHKLEKSYYKTIKLIDKREDTTSLGIVQQGMLNAKAKVIPTSSISSQFQSILNSINGDDTKKEQWFCT